MIVPIPLSRLASSRLVPGLALAATLIGHALRADTPEGFLLVPGERALVPTPSRPSGSTPTARLSPALARAQEALTQPRAYTVQATASRELVTVDFGVEAVEDEAAASLEARLVTLGATHVARTPHLWSARLPLRAVKSLAALPQVRFVREALPSAQAGTVTTQGDRAQKTDVVRTAAPLLDGRGIKVGVISDSYDLRPGSPSAADDVASGDLPPDVIVLQELDEAGSGTLDEGRAMMQVIHDIAPGAKLFFQTGFLGAASFAGAIRSLRAAGCDIIVDDVLYFDQPFFQDGVVAQAIDEVVADGAVYITAAGNFARRSYESNFRSATITPPVPAGAPAGFAWGTFHDFDPGLPQDIYQEVEIPVGDTVTFCLQWDEPFLSVSGLKACELEVDLLLFSTGATPAFVGPEEVANNYQTDAVETLSIRNEGLLDKDGLPGADTRFNIAIQVVRPDGAPAPRLNARLKLTRFGPDTVKCLDFDTQSGTIAGHTNATGALTVGAVFYANTPVYSATPPSVEPYSGAGRTPICFDILGNRLASPLLRQKPEVVAPTGGNHTFLGIDRDGDGIANFSGTSAAAPHVAGLVALLLQKAGGPGSLNPAQVRQLLQSNALDIPTPGVDDSSGYGLVDAVATLADQPSGYPYWQLRSFTGSTPAPQQLPAADPDNDGLPNLAEYFTGSNPTSPSAIPLTLTAADGPFRAQVRRSLDADPDHVALQVSTDLKTWTTQPVTWTIAPGPPGTEYWSHTWTPSAPFGPQYWRLIVE